MERSAIRGSLSARMDSRIALRSIRATNLFLASTVLHAKRFVAAAAFLTDRGKVCLERVEIVGRRVIQHDPGGAGCLCDMGPAESLESVAQRPSEGLADDVTGDERR